MKTREEAKPERKRIELSAAKSREIVGIVLIVLAGLLAASLISHDPADPSFLRRAPGGNAVHNVIGSVGAQVSAAGFGFLGLTVLLLPLLLLVQGGRRLMKRPLVRVVFDAKRNHYLKP
ncbi:MAG TPA: DNA translocase FtsK 4TM domain-containing protein, partial [Thermoanaerobaculia bacterium]|nr:DNA translocase FtsK 4TM domain-containing protein [Thermoanaerobaculia bacterium]